MPKKKEVESEVEKAINKKYGKNTIQTLGAPRKTEGIEVVPTELVGLDIATSCLGIPKGSQVEIFGPESLGKTSLSEHIGSKHLKYTSRKMGVIDVEHAFDPDFARTFDLDPDSDRIFITQPDTGEQALEITQMMIKSREYSFIMIDSTASLVPKRELEGDLGDATMAERARLLSKACPQFAAQCKKTLTTLFWVNQIRMKIGVRFGDPTTTPGGQALKFYSHMRLRLGLPQENRIKRGEVVIGKRTKVTVVKNKCGVPFRNAIVEHLFADGFQEERSVVKEGLLYKVLNKRKAKKGHLKGKDCVFFGKKNLGGHDKHLTKLDNGKIDKYRDDIVEAVYAEL